MSKFLTEGFPLKIDFQYNLNHFSFMNDPIESISYEIGKMLIDDVSLLQDGSRICVKEKFADNGYPARALYNLKNKDSEIHYADEYIHCDLHPEDKETKIKITLMPELLPFLKESLMNRMCNEKELVKYITHIVEATLYHDVIINCISFGFSDNDFEMEFTMKRD